MLNEFLEFEAFVTNPKSDNPRLQPQILTKRYQNTYALDGIGSILTIIARGFIFTPSDRNGSSVYDKGLEVVKKSTCEVLSRWCGMDTPSGLTSPEAREWFEKYPEADGWLKEFWIYNYQKYLQTSNGKKRPKDGIKASNDGEIEAAWEKLIQKWKDNFLDYDLDYDYKAEQITFKNVIASAIGLKSLKERYLVIKKDMDDKIRDNKVKTNSKDLTKEMARYEYLYTYKDNTKVSTKIKLLRNITSFLIWQEEHPGKQKEVLLDRIRLLGWYGQDDYARKLDTWFLSHFKWEDKPIMIRSDEHSDFAKYGIDNEFLEHFEIELIDAANADQYQETHWILKDVGHGLNVPFEVINI